jgi:excinuclease ABC subunit C
MSVNLKQRMLSHFPGDLIGFEKRMRQMVLSVKRFSFHETGSDLLALLLEDKLIKEQSPAYNIRQQQFSENRYLIVTEDTYPTIKIGSSLRKVGSGAVFGPFKNRYFAAELLRLVHQYLCLRSCSESFPSERCLSYEVGSCRGPCRGEISQEAYARIVERAVAFLNGDVSDIVDQLSAEMETAAAGLDYERAEDVRQRIEFLESFGRRQQFVRNFREQILTITQNGATPAGYEFTNGRLTTCRYLSSGKDMAGWRLLNAEGQAEEDVRFVVDRAHIVHRYRTQVVDEKCCRVRV